MVEKTGLNKKVGSRQKAVGRKKRVAVYQCHSDPALAERNLALP
jgi:hypothetical protein